MTLFSTSGFDLDAYLARIGITDRAGDPVTLLQAIALRHPCAIPFENLDPLLRRPVSLDIDSIQRKLVRAGRGGWCFEHNLLLGTALTALGYDVSGLSARVLWAVPAGVVRGRTHMALHVRLDGTDYIVDCGFGGSTPTAPLTLDVDAVQATPHESVRLSRRGDGDYVLAARLEREWRDLYAFDLQRQKLADYEQANWFLCHHPDTQLLTNLVAARADDGCRYALRNAELAVHRGDGLTERRALGTGGEIRHALEDLFRIRVPPGAEVDDALERLASRPPP